MMKQVVVNPCVQKGILTLVNKDHPFHHEMELETIQLEKEIELAKVAALAMEDLLQDVHAKQEVVYVSGKRSYQEQKSLYDSSLKENGEEFTKAYVAYPSCSEHETGLAIDLGIKMEKIDYIRPYFPDEGIAKVCKDAMSAYGFILRYPENKQDITHISYEPWHFRYVGIPHAIYMKQHDLVLEEYIEILQTKTSRDQALIVEDDRFVYEIFTIETPTTFALEDSETIHYSGDNVSKTVVWIQKDRSK